MKHVNYCKFFPRSNGILYHLSLIPCLLSTVSCLLFFTSCAPKAVETLKEIRPCGDNVICILAEESEFKTEIISRLTQSLSDHGFIVITDKRNHAHNYNPRGYAAIVYMTEYWAWHTPWHAKRYYSKHHQPSNVIFVVTSGDPKVTIKKPFDAVTSASEKGNIERVYTDIMVRPERIIGKKMSG